MVYVSMRLLDIFRTEKEEDESEEDGGFGVSAHACSREGYFNKPSEDIGKMQIDVEEGYIDEEDFHDNAEFYMKKIVYDLLDESCDDVTLCSLFFDSSIVFRWVGEVDIDSRCIIFYYNNRFLEVKVPEDTRFSFFELNSQINVRYELDFADIEEFNVHDPNSFGKGFLGF